MQIPVLNTVGDMVVTKTSSALLSRVHSPETETDFSPVKRQVGRAWAGKPSGGARSSLRIRDGFLEEGTSKPSPGECRGETGRVQKAEGAAYEKLMSLRHRRKIQRLRDRGSESVGGSRRG